MNPAEDCILLTGFDAFGDGQPNSSEWLVNQLNGMRIGHARVVGHVLPTCFDVAARQLSRTAHALRRRVHLPLIVCTGMAADRQGFSLEHVAINWRDAPIADNAGTNPGMNASCLAAPLRASVHSMCIPCVRNCTCTMCQRQSRSAQVHLCATKCSTR